MTPTTEQILALLYPKSRKCAVCEKEFTELAVRKSKLKTPTKIDTDFLSHYKEIDPNHYEVIFCIYCGYAALMANFDVITQRQRDILLAEIGKNHKPVEFDAPYSLEMVVTRYNQAMKCATAINAKASIKAFIALKLSWVLRVAGKHDLEKKFSRMAYDGLVEAYSDERFPLGNMDETTAKYIIADLARRNGLMGEAMRWVADVVVAKGIPSAIKEKASLLKDMIREGNTK